MAWTYTDAPGTVPADAVRALIGDTDTDDQLLTDAIIAYCISQTSSTLDAALKAAKMAAATLAREMDRDIDGLKTSRSQRHKAMLNVIAALEDEAARENASYTVPEAGQVADVTGYPRELEHTDLGRPDCDED